MVYEVPCCDICFDFLFYAIYCDFTLHFIFTFHVVSCFYAQYMHDVSVLLLQCNGSGSRLCSSSHDKIHISIDNYTHNAEGEI